MGLKSQKRSYFEQAMCGVMCCANNWIKYNIYSPERIWKNAKAVCITPTVQLSPVRMGPLGKPPAEPSTSAPSIFVPQNGIQSSFSSGEWFRTEFRESFLYRGTTGISPEQTYCSVYSVFCGMLREKSGIKLRYRREGEKWVKRNEGKEGRGSKEGGGMIQKRYEGWIRLMILVKDNM